jgi:hypothetical protein
VPKSCQGIVSNGRTPPPRAACPSLAPAPQLSTAGILAAQRPPSSPRSCPDLSSLQISSQSVNVAASDRPSQDSIEPSERLSRASTPGTSARRSRSRKIAATGDKTSRKARSVLGRFRALRRIAAAKMAQSPIRIDTSVHGTKRGFSDEGNGDSENSSALEFEDPAQGETGLPGLPPFLNLPLPGQ